jgi:hypothetical protein
LQRDVYRSANGNLDGTAGFTYLIWFALQRNEGIDDILIFQAMESNRRVDESDVLECLCENNEGFFLDVIISRLIDLVKIEGKQESPVAFWSWI